MDMSWMAWTWQTALFFILIFLTLVGMGIWSVKAPQAPRVGILRIETTPGDRLFISLLGSAWICLLWLAVFGSPLWWALVICVVFAALVFWLV